MKKFLSLLAVVLTMGLATVSMDVEAKRFGGSKSFGFQKSKTPTPPSAAPAQKPPVAGAAAGAAGSTRSGWMGPIAGLAAGLGLMALASHFGFGEAMANMMMMGLLAVGVMLLIGFFMRKKAALGTGSGSGLNRMAYAQAGAAPSQTGNARPTAFTAQPSGSMIGSALSPAASGIGSGSGTSIGRSTIPADFDVAAFVRNAKVNFIRLQAANDAANLDDIRQFTTPEVFAEAQMDLSDRGAAAQHTDVVQLNAEVMEVDEEADRYVVTVHFTGETRENGASQTEAVNELWHLVKPRHGSGGWLLAGIQQMQ